jgi:Putative stress-responsive transcriptional regulator
MEKTISITLNNQSFVIEEDAYNKLSDYLENIKAHCGAGADAAEVIADIENSMAEKLKSNLTPYKEVITSANVDALIEIMGTAEDFDREVGGATADNHAEDGEDKVERKLYRDMDNAIIGGVAAGLGNYFDIDPVLIRVIFIALIFAGGSAFPIYILLWIAMPEAKTAHQKLEMKGQAPTLAAFKNLSKTGKKIQDNFKSRWQKRSALGKILTLPAVIIRGFFMGVKKIWSKVWPIIKFLFGLGLTIFSFVGLGLIGVGSLYMLLYNNSAYQLSFIPISELTSLLPYTWMIILGFLSLAIPTALMFICGLSLILRKNILNLAMAGIILGSWLFSGIFFCALSLRYFPEIQHKFDSYPLLIQEEKAVDLKGVKEIETNGHIINVLVTKSTSTPATLSGRTVDLNNIEMNRVGDKLILTQKDEDANKICLNCHLDQVELKLATSSTLKITTKNGASIYDETAPKEEEEEMENEDIEEINSDEIIPVKKATSTTVKTIKHTEAKVK